MKDIKTAAVVLAAGQGKRMNSSIPKQYLLIKGKPVIYYTLKAFEESDIDQIILVVASDEMEYCRKEIIEHYGFKKVTQVIEGGSERYVSVYQGLCVLDNIDYVLIHDGARPFISADLINNIIIQVAAYKACVVGVPVKDTIKIVDEDNIVVTTPPRDKMWMIQTPQAFEYDLIRKAYNGLMEQEDIMVTDDAMVLEQMLGYKVKIIEGTYRNIKITTPEDIQIAESFIP
jgi:2-C-methyl-D-erythritol 4-phosphate cytidylyltransferase